MWRVFDPERTRHWAPRAARGAYPITAVKSRIFVQNRRFSNKKWAAKSRIFVQNRRFSNKKWAAKSRIFVQNRCFSNKKWAAKSRIFVQNRRFSNKKWAAKSRIFVQNRRFSSKKWAAKLCFTSPWKSDDFVDFQIRSEKLQNHNKEMGYARTHGRTHARTKTIFLVNGFKNPALRAGHNVILLKLGSK